MAWNCQLQRREVGKLISNRQKEMLDGYLRDYHTPRTKAVQPKISPSDFRIVPAAGGFKFSFSAQSQTTISRTFTGKKGNAFAIKVIELFNSMEKELLKRDINIPFDSQFIYQIAGQMKELEEKVKKEIQLRLVAEKTKAYISTSREASVMGKLGQTERKLHIIESRLGEAENLKTVVGWISEYPQFCALGSETKIVKESVLYYEHFLA